MVKRTEAQKEAEKRWRLKNPAITLHTPIHIYTALKQTAEELNISHHGLINHILVEWLANHQHDSTTPDTPQ